jgi:hypothetical protein
MEKLTILKTSDKNSVVLIGTNIEKKRKIGKFEFRKWAH